MDTYWKISTLFVTAALIRLFHLAATADELLFSVDEDVCFIITRTTYSREPRSHCHYLSLNHELWSLLTWDEERNSTLAILKEFEGLGVGTFMLSDITDTGSPNLCFGNNGKNFQLLNLYQCESPGIPLVCLCPCSSTRAEKNNFVNPVFEKSVIGEDTSSSNREGRAVDSRGSVKYNPIHLLAGDSREREEIDSDEDVNYDDREGVFLLPKDESDLTTIHNAEHDLNALSVGRNNNVNLDVAVDILDNVLSLDRNTLSRQRTSVTNILLSFDRAVELAAVKEDSTVQSLSPRVAVVISDTKGLTRVSGLVLSCGASDLIQLDCLHVTEEDLSPNHLGNISNIDGAVLLPQSLRTKTRAAFTVFAQDTLFHPVINSTDRVNSRVISVSFNSEQYLNKVPDNEYVHIVFKPKVVGSTKRKCVFWDFSTGGHWSSTGCELIQTSSSGLDICRCNHATHFAEIITDAGADNSDSTVLDIVSMVGCSLSLLGVLGIAVTALIFRRWRAELGNKFLLHLAAAIALNMATFLAVAAGVTSHSNVTCIALGALLHYSLLACFCWMLVCAVLQFLRLVIVFSDRGTHLLLKCAIFAWGAPLIPVVVLLAIDYNLYTSEGRTFCYPRGIHFYSAVLGPVALIVFNNIIAFIVILYNIYPCCANSRDKSFIRNRIHDRRYTLRCLRLSVLLFFLFGLTWIFGFLSRTTIFAYLFCTCATLQGLVLFIFFIVGEKNARKLWNERTQSWAWSKSTEAPITYIGGSNGTSGPRTTVTSDGRVETSFDF